VEAQNSLLDKTQAQLKAKLEKLAHHHETQSKELKAELSKAQVTLHDSEVKHKLLKAAPTPEDIEKERKKVQHEHHHRFKQLEQKGHEEVEVERRKGHELRRGHETIAQLEVKISKMLETCQGLESQADVHLTGQATAAQRLQEFDAANRSLAVENERLAYRLQELEGHGQRYDTLHGQHNDYRTKVMQLQEQMRQSEEVSVAILRQEEVHARLVTETNVLEARVLQAANVAAERGEKVQVLSAELQALKLRQQEMQTTQLPEHAQLTNLLLTSEVSEKEAEAEMIRTQEELARLRQEAAMAQPLASLETPSDGEITALLGELDAAKVAMRKNEVRIEKMRQRQEREQRQAYLVQQRSVPEPKPRSAVPKAKPSSSPSKSRLAPPSAAGKASVEAVVVEKFVADSLDPNSLSLQVGENVTVVATSGAWATVKTAAGQTGVAPIVCLQLEEAPVTVPPARDIRPKQARTGKSPTGVPKAAAKPKVTSPAVRASAAERQQRLSGQGVRQVQASSAPGQSLRARAAGGGYAGVASRAGRPLDKPVLGRNTSPRTQMPEGVVYTTSPMQSPLPSPGASPPVTPGLTTAFVYPTGP